MGMVEVMLLVGVTFGLTLTHEYVMYLEEREENEQYDERDQYDE